MLDQENQLQIYAIDLFAGSLGGAVQICITQPLDTVKVKQQTFPKLYKSMTDCFRKTYRAEGIFRGLYAGTTPAIIANIAENSVLFAAYGGCQKVVTHIVGKNNYHELNTLENASAGFLAAFFSSFTFCPTELIKCQVQANRELLLQSSGAAKSTVNITPWRLTRHIMATEGLSGFYRGLSSTLIREMPGYFVFFGAYEGTRELLRSGAVSKEDIGALRTMLAGAVAGSCSWTFIFPADVIKSRIQVNNLKSSLISVGLTIFRTEGVFAFYSGLLPTVLRSIPASASLFLVYEYTKKIFK